MIANPCVCIQAAVASKTQDLGFIRNTVHYLYCFYTTNNHVTFRTTYLDRHTTLKTGSRSSMTGQIKVLTTCTCDMNMKAICISVWYVGPLLTGQIKVLPSAFLHEMLDLFCFTKSKYVTLKTRSRSPMTGQIKVLC